MKHLIYFIVFLAAGSLTAFGADDCTDHDHDHEEPESGLAPVPLSAEIADKIGFEVREASGGVIDQSASFPGEVILNRDRVISVKPRFPSIVKALHVEIGDQVKQGQLLATLENRDTLSVYTRISALDGTVIAKHVSVGESAGEDTALYDVADLSTVWVDLHIFPNFQHRVRKGQPVTLIAADGHTANTTIQHIGPLVSKESRTLLARCVLEQPGEDFLPGAFVRAVLAVDSREAAVRVEKDAVQLLDGEPVVFVESGEGYLPREVETGLAGGDFIEIKHGLAPGERYVAQGSFDLKAEILTSGMDPHAGHGH